MGAAAATVLAQFIALVICSFYMIHKYELLRLNKNDFKDLESNMVTEMLGTEMLTMMFFSFASTSSNVQLNLSLFCDISRADVATPPALAALPGANIHRFPVRYFVASNVVGMLAPSATANIRLQLTVLHLQGEARSELHMEERCHI